MLFVNFKLKSLNYKVSKLSYNLQFMQTLSQGHPWTKTKERLI